MNILKLDLILFIFVGIPMSLIWARGIQKRKEKFIDEIKDEIYREQEYTEAEMEFQTIEADLKQHLKNDGFIQPQPGSEEHYQRWKAEREKREP